MRTIVGVVPLDRFAFAKIRPLRSAPALLRLQAMKY
jgi:hypothetical protein